MGIDAGYEEIPAKLGAVVRVTLVGVNFSINRERFMR